MAVVFDDAEKEVELVKMLKQFLPLRQRRQRTNSYTLSFSLLWICLDVDDGCFGPMLSKPSLAWIGW